MNTLFLIPTPASVLSASKKQLIDALQPAKKAKDWYELKADQLIQAAKSSTEDSFKYSEANDILC